MIAPPQRHAPLTPPPNPVFRGAWHRVNAIAINASQVIFYLFIFLAIGFMAAVRMSLSAFENTPVMQS